MAALISSWMESGRCEYMLVLFLRENEFRRVLNIGSPWVVGMWNPGGLNVVSGLPVPHVGIKKSLVMAVAIATLPFRDCAYILSQRAWKRLHSRCFHPFAPPRARATTRPRCESQKSSSMAW